MVKEVIVPKVLSKELSKYARMPAAVYAGGTNGDLDELRGRIHDHRSDKSHNYKKCVVKYCKAHNVKKKENSLIKSVRKNGTHWNSDRDSNCSEKSGYCYVFLLSN